VQHDSNEKNIKKDSNTTASDQDIGDNNISIEEEYVIMCHQRERRRYVVVANIPGAFLHEDMDQDIHMLLEDTITELIVKLEPKLYRK